MVSRALHSLACDILVIEKMRNASRFALLSSWKKLAAFVSHFSEAQESDCFADVGWIEWDFVSKTAVACLLRNVSVLVREAYRRRNLDVKMSTTGLQINALYDATCILCFLDAR